MNEFDTMFADFRREHGNHLRSLAADFIERIKALDEEAKRQMLVSAHGTDWTEEPPGSEMRMFLNVVLHVLAKPVIRSEEERQLSEQIREEYLRSRENVSQ